MCSRVLVIDDDPVNLDLMTYLLNAFGHTHCGHRIGGISRICEQVQPDRSHMPAHILAHVPVTHKDRFQPQLRRQSFCES